VRSVLSAGLVAAFVVVACPAAAQGHRGAPPGQLKPKTPEPTPAASTPASAADVQVAALGPSIEPRGFGMWLDDATLAAPGSVWLSASMMRWSTPSGHGFDAPAIGGAIGLTRRAQLSLSIPYSRVTNEGDALASGGLGDVYAGIKLEITEPAERRIGVSVSPTLEILTSATTRRTSLVLPASVEVGLGQTRAYGSVGVFTRGAAFLTGAIERQLSERVLVTAALLQSWTTADAAASDTYGLGRTRTDVSGMVTVFAGPSTAFFGGITRTLSAQEFDSARFALSGGISVAVVPPSAVPIRPPR
jgi:hypothetical protein